MEKLNLEVKKTARIHTIGTLGKHIKKVWIVFHGYGMQSTYFIRKFEGLDDGATLVLAPEGLSRFYLSGTYGRVGASWMTKEDREDDIEDNMNYIDQIYDHVLEEAGEEVELTILGFSQGSPTACRWLVHRKPENARLMVWGSDVPKDVLTKENRNYLNRLNTRMFIGDNDPYISADRLEQFREVLNEFELNYELIVYNGEHKVMPDVLQEYV